MLDITFKVSVIKVSINFYHTWLLEGTMKKIYNFRVLIKL